MSCNQIYEWKPQCSKKERTILYIYDPGATWNNATTITLMAPTHTHFNNFDKLHCDPSEIPQKERNTLLKRILKRNVSV